MTTNIEVNRSASSPILNGTVTSPNSDRVSLPDQFQNLSSDQRVCETVYLFQVTMMTFTREEPRVAINKIVIKDIGRPVLTKSGTFK